MGCGKRADKEIGRNLPRRLFRRLEWQGVKAQIGKAREAGLRKECCRKLGGNQLAGRAARLIESGAEGRKSKEMRRLSEALGMRDLKGEKESVEGESF